MERDRALEEERKRRKLDSDDDLDEDGYLRHSDSEGDWSGVGDTLGRKNKTTISRKLAKRQRQWCADDDAATAAGRPWPVFPRNLVAKVLATVIDEVLKSDAEEGVFSVPVPRDEFPEYYEQIKQPMDYGTMKTKLEKGEYRSAQAMQKDFILVMQNCLQFNSPNSDIVKEARKQALMRPGILRKAAEKHDLFLTEDGSVLEIVDEEQRRSPKPVKKRKRRRRNKITGMQVHFCGMFWCLSIIISVNFQFDAIVSHKLSLKFELTGELEDVSTAFASLREFVAEGITSRHYVYTIILTKFLCYDQYYPASKPPPSSDDEATTPIKHKSRKRSMENGDDADDEGTGRKPRIKISMGKNKSSTTKVKVKRRRRRCKITGELLPLPPSSDEEETTPAPPRKRKRVNEDEDDDDDIPITEMKKKTEEKKAKENSSTQGSVDLNNNSDGAKKGDAEDKDSIFMDVEHWKKEHEKLDGSFMAARALFTRHGSWSLPGVNSERQFRLIAKSLMVKMDR